MLHTNYTHDVMKHTKQSTNLMDCFLFKSTVRTKLGERNKAINTYFYLGSCCMCWKLVMSKLDVT